MDIPIIGLGTWQLNGAECEKTIHQALELGYRHLDTADVYGNHREIGRGIRGFPRKELFLTSKLWKNDLTPDKVKSTTMRFLEELQVDYLDLLLIHWPSPDSNLIDTLKTMLELKEKGTIKNMGVSNFVRSNLEQMDPYHFPILTNQIELHPYLQRRQLVEACQKAGIRVTAYRPLAKGAFEQDVLMQKIGKKYDKTPSQVALRWIIQKNYIAIPKASNVKHLKENLEVLHFDLSAADMHEIDLLDSGTRYCAPEGLPVLED